MRKMPLQITAHIKDMPLQMTGAEEKDAAANDRRLSRIIANQSLERSLIQDK